MGMEFRQPGEPTRTHTTLLLASAFPSASLFCLHACPLMWSNTASPQGPCYMIPLKPSSTLRPATLSPAQLSHMSSVGAVTKVRSTGPSPASTAELRGPSLVMRCRFQRGGVLVERYVERCLLQPKGVFCEFQNTLLTVWWL